MSNYHYTLSGSIKLCLSNCRNNARYRLKLGRTEAGVFDITYKDVMDLWNSQNGRCYYSGIPLNYDKNEWRISIDRIDTSKGYTRDNIVLTCIELNSPIQWSVEKVDEMLDILDKNITENDVDFDAIKPRKNYGKVRYNTIDGVQQRTCTYCNLMRPVDSFPTPNYNACNDCFKTARKCHSLKSHIAHMLNNTKNSTKIRLKNPNKKVDYTHDIDIEFIIKLYNDQKGLCAYSGIPLRLINPSTGNWAASVERKNPLKGYTRDNVCLICREFNSADNSAKQTTLESGTSGWTPEKFQLFLGYAWLKKGVIASEDELKCFIDMQKETNARKYHNSKETNARKYNSNPLRTRRGINALRAACARRAQFKRIHGEILIITSPSNKQYIYQTDIIDQSIHNVFSKIRKAGHTVMIEDIAKYGESAFKVEPILICKRDELEHYQNMFIHEYNTITPNGLNPSFQNSKEWNKKISLGVLKHGTGHDGRELPFYMKYAEWVDRDGYRIEGHPLCKRKYFINTNKTIIKKSYNELYEECLACLNDLNERLQS